MPDTLWDLVPHVPLYEDPDQVLHASGEICSNNQYLRTSQLVETSLAHTSNSAGPPPVCTSTTCQALVSTEGLWYVHNNLLRAQGLKEWPQRNGHHELTFPLVNSALAMTSAPRIRVGKNLEVGYEMASKSMREELDRVLTTMRTSTYQQDLYEKLIEQTARSQRTMVALTNHKLGPRDMGLVVGVTGDSGDDVKARVLPRIYAKEHPGKNFVMRAPIGVLAHVAMPSYQDDTRTKTAQVALLPPNYTPELEEIIAGLYDPYSYGRSRQLRDVIEAAQVLCKKDQH